jgi:hypothetical protein
MTEPAFDDYPEVGADVLDAEVGGPELRPLGLADVLGRTRAALGLRPLAAPALVFVPAGVLLGPYVTGWLDLNVLAYLYPVVAIALAVLGLFVGFGLDLRPAGAGRLLAAASVEAVITIGMVAGALGFLLQRWGAPLDVALVPLTLVFGVCASASSGAVSRPDDPPRYRTASIIADLDDVLPIVLGGVVLALLARASAGAAVWLFGLSVGAALAVAAAGWMLFERTEDPAERGLFVVGVIALLGGGAAYLGASPLLAGMVAGVFWRHAPGHADRIILGDLRRLQHPLVVLLLVFAGASAVPGALALWLVGPYVLMRLTGKLLGGWVLARWMPEAAPADLGHYLLPPGVIGLAFTLAFHLASSSAASATALTAVAAGTLAGEVLGAFALLGARRK